MTNPKKNGAIVTAKQQLAALVEQRNSGLSDNLVPPNPPMTTQQPVYGSGQLVASPAMPMSEVVPTEVYVPQYNQPEIYIPMNSQQRPPQQQSSYPIVYSASPQKPQQQTPVVWFPNVIHEDLGRYAISNQWRFLHLFWGCITSPFYQPGGTAKAIAVIVIGTAGVIFCTVGIISLMTGQQKTITVDPSQIRQADILTPIQRTVDIR